MTWTLVAQILILTLVGGMTVSTVAGDIQKRHAAGRVLVAKALLEAQAEIHKAHTEGMPWDAR